MVVTKGALGQEFAPHPSKKVIKLNLQKKRLPRIFFPTFKINFFCRNPVSWGGLSYIFKKKLNNAYAKKNLGVIYAQLFPKSYKH